MKFQLTYTSNQTGNEFKRNIEAPTLSDAIDKLRAERNDIELAGEKYYDGKNWQHVPRHYGPGRNRFPEKSE